MHVGFRVFFTSLYWQIHCKYKRHSTLILTNQRRKMITKREKLCSWIVGFLAISFPVVVTGQEEYISALGDPGMRRDGLRVALEGWNNCNEVGQEAPNMGSPRAADCFDVYQPSETDTGKGGKECDYCKSLGHVILHRVTEEDNKLGVGAPFMGISRQAVNDVDLYAAEKEVYLGSKCQVQDTPNPWSFWMIMLKNGNMDTLSGICPENGRRTGPFRLTSSKLPCFGAGCMNQPTVFHQYTRLYKKKNMATLKGSFYGSYDLDASLEDLRTGNQNFSYYSVTWMKQLGVGGWIFHHVLRTSEKYPWLMLYLRADAAKGFSGGYHYETRGMMKTIPESPNFKVRLTLDIKKGGGPKSQFYLLDMGSCWKNNGDPCDGDVTTDVTRYSEMIINPNTSAWCKPDDLKVCPPYHTLPNGTQIHRNDTANYPYGAYHMYCSPGNAKHLEDPYIICDPWSNPMAQEILQILPHPAWGPYGYPTKQGEGWIGDPRTWELDVGGLSSALYFYQDPGTSPARRLWPSIDVGTEIYISNNEVAEWTLRDFDIIIPKS